MLPTGVSLEVQLTLLLAFADLKAAAVWTQPSPGELRPLAHAGEFKPRTRSTRELARRLLNGEVRDVTHEGALTGARVEPAHESPAAVVARAGTGPSPDRTFLLETVLPTLSATLERDELLSRGSASQQEVLAATTRRLARLRFDLHDGPQQDVMMLAEDLRFFRDQLASATAQTSSRDRILGRVDDLQARLVALDGDLRRISASLQSPFLQPHSLRNAIKQLTEAFTARTAVKPEVKLRGEFTHLTDSQQIALLALIREALANVREHSNAKHVSVSLNVGAKGVVATVSDDGQGFDPEATLVKAAREGHLGLVGMHERVRLLGGHTQIDSQPGGPTVISVRLPPVAADTAALEADAAVLD
jgi:signal transduction histidine kinase